ncbi:MAG: two-component regulator propeller domain-containing protein [Bacteroidota bacterium]
MRFFGILLLVSIQIGAQQPQFEPLTKTDGLSNNSVLSILKDSRGFMWFGTFDGLNKYDGTNFTVYRHDPSKKGSISNNRIQTLFEDSRQNIWVGTTNGLNCYNPKKDEFTVYLQHDSIPNSISHQNIKAIQEDENGFIWIGTIGGGLNRYDYGSDTFKRYQFDKGNTSSIDQDYILSLSQTKNGFLWVGLAGRGVDIMDIKNEKFYHIPYWQQQQSENFKNNVIRDICPVNNGTLLLSTYGGFNVLNTKNLNIKSVDTLTYRIDAPFQHFEHHPKTKSPQLSHSSIHSSVVDARGNYWIATYGGGLNWYNPMTKAFKSYMAYRYQGSDKSFDSIFDLFYDKEQDLLWVATAEQGVLKINLSPKPFHFEDTEYNQINAIAEDAKFYWKGTYSNGILRKNKQTGEVLWIQNQKKVENSLSSNFITDMEMDARGNLWIATEHMGVDLLLKENFEKPRFKHFQYQKNDINSIKNNAVQDLEMLSDSVVLAASSYGVSFINTINHKVTRWNALMSKNQDIYKAIHKKVLLLNDGEILLGGQEQLFSLRPKGQFPKRFDVKAFTYILADTTSISDNIINDMIQDLNGDVWIGTERGLNKYLPETGKFIRYTEVWNGRVMSLLSDQNKMLWIGTEAGIIRFNPNSGAHYLFEVQKDGKALEIYKDAKRTLSNGKLGFGTENGYVSFYPDSLQVDSTFANLQFTNLTIFGKPYQIQTESKEKVVNRTYLKNHISHTEELHMPYDDKLFTIHFAAMDHRSPRKIGYRYRLLGWDNQWVSSGNMGKAQFTNLNPGDYVLQVIATNVDGVWNENPKEMKVSIIPPWWMTWWFKSILIIGFLLLISLPFYLRIQRLKKEQLAQQRIIEVIADTQEQERQRISRDLHDSVGGQLVGIKQQLNSLSKDVPQIAQSIVILDETYDEVRRISHNIMPGTLMKFGLAAGIESISAMARSEKTNINTYFHEIEGHFDKDYETNVFRIVQELMQNALKHGEPSNITIGLTKHEKELNILIEDDGQGFDTNNISQNEGNGLKNVRHRVERLMGKLFIYSTPGKGTEVNIELPIT